MHSHSESTYGRICYKQPLNNLIYTLEIILLRRILSVSPLRNLPVNKDLENLAEFNLLQNLHLCTQKSVCATNFGPLGEIGTNFSHNLHRKRSSLKL